MLSFTPRLSGSCAEGTKVMAVDEADILCVFDDDSWKHITLSQVSNDVSHAGKLIICTDNVLVPPSIKLC